MGLGWFGWGGVENRTDAQTGKDIDRLLPVLCALSPRQPTNDERNESPPMAALQTHIQHTIYTPHGTYSTRFCCCGSIVDDDAAAAVDAHIQGQLGFLSTTHKKGGKKQVLCQRDIFFWRLVN